MLSAESLLDEENPIASWGVHLTWPRSQDNSTDRRLYQKFCHEIEKQLNDREPGRFRIDEHGRLREHPDWITLGHGKTVITPHSLHQILRDNYCSIFPDQAFPSFIAPADFLFCTGPVEPHRRSIRQRLAVRLGISSRQSTIEQDASDFAIWQSNNEHSLRQLLDLQAAFFAASANHAALVGGLGRWLNRMKRMREPRDVIEIEIPMTRRSTCLGINGISVNLRLAGSSVSLVCSVEPGFQIEVSFRRSELVELGQITPALSGVSLLARDDAVRVFRTPGSRCSKLTCMERNSESCSVIWLEESESDGNIIDE